MQHLGPLTVSLLWVGFFKYLRKGFYMFNVLTQVKNMEMFKATILRK